MWLFWWWIHKIRSVDTTFEGYIVTHYKKNCGFHPMNMEFLSIQFGPCLESALQQKTDLYSSLCSNESHLLMVLLTDSTPPENILNED